MTFFPGLRTTGDKGGRFANWLLGVHPDLPLDRVFLRGLEAESATVLPQDSSDHRPLRVELTAR